MLRCLASTSISFSTTCEKLVGMFMILGTGEASDFRIRRLNGMDILENGTSMSLLQVLEIPVNMMHQAIDRRGIQFGVWRVAGGCSANLEGMS